MRASTAPKKKRKKPTAGQLTRRADKWFSLYIRKRDGFCQSGRSLSEGCQGALNLQCAHGFSRRYFGTRWEEWNAVALCAACHVYFTHRPLEWEAWLQDRWGRGAYDERRRFAMYPFAGEKAELAAHFKAKYEELCA